MKSLNHRICGVAFLMAIGSNILELVYTFFASSLPDQIERVGRAKILKHRGVSHDLGLWGGMLALFIFAPFIPTELIYAKIFSIKITFRTWILIFPPFFHVLMDMFTSKGVPLFFKIRLRIPLLGQSKWYEYYLSWGFLCVAFFFYAPSAVKSFLSFIKNIFKLL